MKDDWSVVNVFSWVLGNFEELKFIYDKMVLAEDSQQWTLAQTLLGEFNDLVAGCGNTGLSGSCGC